MSAPTPKCGLHACRRVFEGFRLRRRWQVVRLVVMIGQTVLVAAPARAQATPANKAVAESLYQSALELYEKRDLPGACAKFAASHDLDPALGTLLRLADCYDRIGRTASAWALFKEAEAIARSRGQKQRVLLARARISDLDARLSRVKFEVAAEARVPGLKLRLNDAQVPTVSYGGLIPVDPGPQRIAASAPGRQPWVHDVDAPAGPAVTKVEVPVLKPAAPAPKANRARGAPERDVVARDEHDSASTHRALAYASGAVGLAGLITSAATGYRAYDLNRQSREHCREDAPTTCTVEGMELRASAQQFATVATISAIAGGVLTAGGITLLLTLPAGGASKSSNAALPAGVALHVRGGF